MALTGLPKICNKRPGGVRKIGLAAVSAIASATKEATGNSYSALTLTEGSHFFRYAFREDTAEFTQKTSVENGVAKITQELSMRFANMSPEVTAELDNVIDTAMCDGLVAVVETYDGNKYIVGYDSLFEGDRPLKVSSTEGTTGKALSDDRGVTLTLSREAGVHAPLYSGDIASLFATT